MAALPKEVLCAGKYLQMVKAGHWEYVERPGIPGAVVIVAVTDDDKLLLVEQERIPLGKRVIELPAGLAGDEDPHESFASCAGRELLEETGYAATTLRQLAEGPTSAGLSNEQVTLFLATGLRKENDGGGDAAEEIVVHEIPLAEVVDWLAAREREGFLIDVKIWAGLYFARTTGQ